MLKKRYKLDIDKMGNAKEGFSLTDIGSDQNMKLLLLGISDNLCFLFYEKGGRIPVKILSLLVAGNKNRREEYILDYHTNIQKIDELKKNIEAGNYINRYF